MPKILGRLNAKSMRMPRYSKLPTININIKWYLMSSPAKCAYCVGKLSPRAEKERIIPKCGAKSLATEPPMQMLPSFQRNVRNIK